MRVQSGWLRDRLSINDPVFFGENAVYTDLYPSKCVTLLMSEICQKPQRVQTTVTGCLGRNELVIIKLYNVQTEHHKAK